MAKFNTKPEKETSINEMGSQAFKLSPEEELVATVLTTFVQKSFYEGENEVLTRIRNAASRCSTEFVAKAALYTRREANMRSSSHVMAGELAARIAGTEWGSRFYKNICLRPDDMAEILGYYMNVVRGGDEHKKITNAMKKGFKAKLESMDAYVIDKYKMPNKAISLIDLVNLFHPKGTDKNTEAYRRLINGESLDGLYTTKILEKEMSKAGQNATNKGTAKKEAITETLETNVGKMPIFNLVRNLRNILENTPEQVDLVVDVVTTREKIINSRMLPFRFASAYAEVEKMSGPTSANKTKILDALEVAISLSCENIPKLIGNTAILIDHSGSMRGGGGRGSKVSTFSNTGSSDIANLFGCMLMQTQDNVYMGLFGDRLIRVDNIDRDKGILKTHTEVHSKGGGVGGGSEHGLFEFFGDVVKNNVRVDNVVIFSDMVIGSNSWYGRGNTGGYSTGSGSFNRLFKEFRKINPQASVISVDIRQTSGTTVFNKELGVTQISGWSEKIFDHMNGMSKGYESIIKEINEIKL